MYLGAFSHPLPITPALFLFVTLFKKLGHAFICLKSQFVCVCMCVRARMRACVLLGVVPPHEKRGSGVGGHFHQRVNPLAQREGVPDVAAS